VKTMREKLIEAARAELEASMPVVDAGLCDAMVDAILIILAKPDHGMEQAGFYTLPDDPDVGDASDCFAAMINHVRSGK